MKIRILPEAERDLDLGADFYDVSGDFIDIYAVLNCRQDPAVIAARLDDQNAGLR
jgi:hypothetical protein